MILILRGHIRNSFETRDLYYLVKELYEIFPDLKIMIHTWNIFANNISWRKINVNREVVNEDTIYEYFDDIRHLIKHIIIDDDTKIQLIGNTHGTINNGMMPIVGWKNYWYGKYRIIDYLYFLSTASPENNFEYTMKNKYELDKNEIDEMVINCRFDIMNNSNSFSKTQIIDFIKMNSERKMTKNIFFFDSEYHCGIDNIYLGNIETMYKLTHHFYYDLDEILMKNNDVFNQERLVYRINSVLFHSK